MKAIGYILTALLYLMFYIPVILAYSSKVTFIQGIGILCLSLFAGICAMGTCEKFIKWYKSNLKDNEKS